MKKFKLSIVVPVYNEEKFIDSVLENLFALPFPDGVELEIIAVNDCSKDGTREKLDAWTARGVKVIHHTKNGGKGAALHTGFAAATGDAVTIQDSDFEYDPQDIPKLLQPILDDKADAVFGARKPFLRSEAHWVMRFWHLKINQFLTVFSNLFSDWSLSDMECCYKMFRRELLDRIHLRENRFGFEPEVTLKVSRLRPRVWEVPVSYSSRSYADGKKITWKDGVSAIRCIIRYGLFRMN